jgi:hypothetical protein
MKYKELEKIIKKHVNLDVKFGFAFDKHDTANIILPDGGIINVGIEPKRKKFPNFLHFNIRNSKLRLSDSNSYNGKYNYFGDFPVETLESLLIELANKIQTFCYK